MNRMLIACLAVMFFVPPARANDSTAELGNRGLALVKNDAIEMRSEDLSISAKLIKVRYRFFNKSDQDVKVHVAFPMPEITPDYTQVDISVPAGFTAVVNGRPVATKLEKKVFVDGVDRTDLLNKFNIPIDAVSEEANEALNGLSGEQKSELVNAGLAKIEHVADYKVLKQYLQAQWTYQATYYWEQVFPAKAEVTVEHSYQPSVGGAVESGLGHANAGMQDWFPNVQKKYCLDKVFLAQIERTQKSVKGKRGTSYTEQRIDYILKSGANWAGPIKDFRLVVDKGRADSLISFCGDGMKQISPTKYEIRKTDFTPQEDLHVLILGKLSR